MDNFTIVRNEHLNHHGYLFGGTLLRWVDEFSWLVASRDYPGCTLVTVAMNDIQFRHRVNNGAILRFNIDWIGQGRTSVRYRVVVYADEPGATSEKEVFVTEVTFVRVDERGNKKALPHVDFLPSRDGYGGPGDRRTQ
ncbi:MAG: acyl-CoA thioesterase [Deltaproteobacteria bacterium]|nr:MAG: acyl-CoA thioesterase [Deltaproteobacteria bacterium]